MAEDSVFPGMVFNPATNSYMTPQDAARYAQQGSGCGMAQTCQTAQSQGQYVGQLPSGQIGYFQSPEAMAAAGAGAPSALSLSQYAYQTGAQQATLQREGSTFDLLSQAQTRVADFGGEVRRIAGQEVAIGAGAMAEYAAGRTQQAFDALAGLGLARFSAGAGGREVSPGGSPYADTVAQGSLRGALEERSAQMSEPVRSVMAWPGATAQDIYTGLSQAVTPASRQAESFADIAAQEATKRAGYYGLPGEGLSEAKTIGDTRSEAIARGLESAAMFGVGPAFKSRETSTGVALEVLRQSEYRQGDTRSAQYYGGELGKLAQRPVEQSSSYHYLGQASGIPVPANPFEYRADLAVEFLKGAPQKAGEAFSPVSGEMAGSLPGGFYGLQQWGWDVALNTDKPGKYAAAPAVSFLPAIGRLGAAEGQYGPYGSLFGGPEYRGTPSSEGIRKQEDFVFTPRARAGVEAAIQVAAFERGEAPVKKVSAKPEPKTVEFPALGKPAVEMVMGPDKKMYPAEFAGGQAGWSKVEGGRLKGSKTVASVATVGTTGELPMPFLSKTAGPSSTVVEAPTGELFGFNLGPLSKAFSFFQQGKETTTTKSVSTIPEVTTLKKTEYVQTPGGLATIQYFETTGGKVVTEAKTEKSTPSGYESWLEGANRFTRDITGISKLPEVTTEQVKKTAPYVALVPGAAPVGMALMTPGISDYAAGYVKGEITAAKEQPVTALAAFGAGMGMGAAFKGVETVFGGLRGTVAAKAISEGGGYRAAEMFAANVPRVAGTALAGVYAVDVGSRVTQKGTDLSPAAAERAGAIMAIEGRPMLAGSVVGYAAPGKISTGVKNIGEDFASFKLSRSGEPNIRLAATSVEGEPALASYTTKSPTIIDYAKYRAQSAIPLEVSDFASYVVAPKRGLMTDISNLPTKTTAYARATPEYLGAVKETVSGAGPSILRPIVEAKVLAKPTIEIGLGRASIEVARYRYAENQPVAEALYGKYFEAKTKLPVKAEQAVISAETGLWGVIQRAKTPGITVKSAIQERGGIGIDTTGIIRPAAEIARINKMQEAIKIAPKPKAEPKSPAIPFKRTTSNIYRKEKPAPATTPIEIKGKGATAVQVAREVPSARVSEGVQVVETDIRGLPIFPVGPSPSSRQRYREEEETQYLRLPLGMKSPGPKTLTTQELIAIPVVGVGLGQKFEEPGVKTIGSQIKREETIRAKDIESGFGVIALPKTGIKPVSDVMTSQRQESVVRPTQRTEIVPDITQASRTRQVTVPKEVVTVRPGMTLTPPPTPTIFPKIGIPPFGGGGGAGGGGRKGSRAYVETLGFATQRTSPFRKSRKTGKK